MLSQNDFIYLRDLVEKKSGISLSSEKMYLLESRLLPVARKIGLATIGDLVKELKSSNNDVLINEIVESMTTNETLFFRDIKPFNIFRDKVIPHLTSISKENTLRIWCAASSSGQEPYSIAMTMLENHQKLKGIKPEILGTDICRTVLRKAEDGAYSQFEIQRGLPIALLMKYFIQEDAGGDKWKIKDEVKKLVKYQQQNLLDDYSHLGLFDVIFCRNVLIYFEPKIKSQILNNLAASLKPHGILFLGSADSVSELTTKFKPFDGEKGIYRLA